MILLLLCTHRIPCGVLVLSALAQPAALWSRIWTTLHGTKYCSLRISLVQNCMFRVQESDHNCFTAKWNFQSVCTCYAIKCMVRFNRSFGAHCTCVLQWCCLLEVVYCSNQLQHATSGPTRRLGFSLYIYTFSLLTICMHLHVSTWCCGGSPDGY